VSFAELIEHALEVLWQLAREFHASLIRRMGKGQTGRMEKGTIEVQDRT
jgi:hypothetical protein